MISHPRTTRSRRMAAAGAVLALTTGITAVLADAGSVGASSGPTKGTVQTHTARARPQVAQTTQSNSGAGSSAALTFARTPAAGDLLIAAVAWASAPASGGAVATPAGWQVLDDSTTAPDTALRTFYRYADGSRASTVFGAAHAPAYLSVAAWDVTGGLGGSVISAHAAGATSSATQTSKSLVQPTAALALVASTIDGNSASVAFDSGWSHDQLVARNYHRLALAHRAARLATGAPTQTVVRWSTPASGLSTRGVHLIVVGNRSSTTPPPPSTSPRPPTSSPPASTPPTSTPPTSSPTPPANGQLPFAIGVHLTDNNGGTHDQGLVPAYENWLGQSVPLATVFGTRGTEQEIEAPAYAVDPLTAAGKTAIISYAIVRSISDYRETWAQASNGSNMTSGGVTYNQRAMNFGKFLVAHGQSHAIIRLVTEFNNGSGGQPAVMDSATHIQQFIAAYRTAYTALKSVDGQHFTIGWDPSPDPGNGTDLTVAYPGDAYVDVINLDDYDAAVPYGAAWTNEQDEWNRRMNGYNGGLGLNYYLNFAAAHGKPVGFPEWGLGWYYANNGQPQAPADVPYFIRQMYAMMTSHHTLYASFWEDYGNGIYTAGRYGRSTPNSVTAYRETFGAKPSYWPAR